MALTHVCVWKPKIGYQRVTIEEACRMFPYTTVSAHSGHFVCELCAQNVTLTAPGERVRHFRHDPANPNKECDDRQNAFDPTYGQALYSLSSHSVPLRVVVSDRRFDLELGFFRPPDRRAHCGRIWIIGDPDRTFVYSFERIERIGTTYLSVGSVPAKRYTIEYLDANDELKRFWPSRAAGVDPKGSIFDGRTGRLVLPGGKAYAGGFYYLLKRSRLDLPYRDIVTTEVARSDSIYVEQWYLYKIQIKKFSESAAQFFLKYSIFLTERPTEFYPIWPAYIREPYLIYHNSGSFYFYLCGEDAELKSFPAVPHALNTSDGRLYRLSSQGREQLLSLGRSGALGFAYLIRKPLDKQGTLPAVEVRDGEGDLLAESHYAKPPKGRYLTVLCPYDGRAVVKQNGRTTYVYKLPAERTVTIDEIAPGTEIFLYQGCDCVRTIRFEQGSDEKVDVRLTDENLVKKLRSCSGPAVPLTHAAASMVGKLSPYPQTRRWLIQAMRRGEIPRSALQLLKATILMHKGG